jgi:hypothetical protein
VVLFPDKHGKGMLLAKTKLPTIPGSSDLLPDPKVAERYKVTPRTIDRWDHQPDLGFPPALRINNRKYRRVSQLEIWERQRIAENARRPQKTEGVEA